MENTLISNGQYALAAFISSGLWVLCLVTAGLFFMASEKWGTTNDAVSVFYLLSIAPLVYFYGVYPSELRLWARIVPALAGLAGIVIPMVGQTLLIFNRIDFEGSKRYFPGMAGVGIWMILVSVLASGQPFASPLVIWVGILTGVGIVLTLTLFLMNRMGNALFYISAGLFVIGYPVWAVLLGRALQMIP